MYDTNTSTKQNTLSVGNLINKALSDVSTIQESLNKMCCLQRNIGDFMDNVMKMTPIKNPDSVISVQVGREDAACYTSIVLDYLMTVDNMIRGIDKTLGMAFELSKSGGASA